MKLSVASWSFPHLTLPEAAAVATAIGFGAIDLGYFFAPSLDKGRLLNKPEKYGTELAASLPLPIANLFHLFGEDLMDRNLAGSANPQNLNDLKSAVAFAKAAGVPSVFILPGMINPGQSRGEATKASVEALKPMVAAGAKAGVKVLIEPHTGSILNSPTRTRELVEAVPGLKIVLDPSHFVAMGFRQEEIDPLADITGHVHLRQARPGLIQTKMEEGVVDFPGFFGALSEAGYDGWLTSEYEHEAGTLSQYDDVLSESVKMRDCLRSWLEA
ncbi:sugar phosphate isomerase/epimerase family protein [Ruegeria hyattellae]|uniref:sugar phosphate isomerase/epimerase family protein n=1 Tax=Ruegeria hyattellae TaxID=3233337 RepID=UPI00355BEA0B